MKIWISLLVLAAALLAAYAARQHFSGEPGRAVTSCNQDSEVPVRLEVRPHAQETTVWCWAASFQMAMEFVKGSPNQCEMANDVYTSANRKCCMDVFSPPASTCTSDGATVDEFQTQVVDKYSVSKRTTRTTSGRDLPLDWIDVTREVCAGTPFLYSYTEPTGGVPQDGHMSVAIGYYTQHLGGGVKQHYLIILNPCGHQTGTGACAVDIEDVPYEYYTDMLTHWADFYAITPK